MKIWLNHKLVPALLYFSGVLCLIFAWHTSNIIDNENSYFLNTYELQQTQHEALGINQPDLIMNGVDVRIFINTIAEQTTYGLISMCFLGILLIFIGIVLHKYNVVFSDKDILNKISSHNPTNVTQRD